MMQDLESACRSCLVNKCGLISMDSLIDRTLKIVECFQMHLNVTITKHGDLPYEICVECLDKLMKARELYLNVMKSEKYLQKRLAESISKRPNTENGVQRGESHSAGTSSMGMFDERLPAGPAKRMGFVNHFEAYQDGQLLESVKTEVVDDDYGDGDKSDDSSSDYYDGDDKANTTGNDDSTFIDAQQSISDQNPPINSSDPNLIAPSESSSSHEPTKKKRKRECRGTYSSYSRAQKELFITLYQNGQSIKEAAISANINNSTARGILRSYAKNQCNIIEQKRGGCRKKKLNDEVLEQIKKCVEGNTRMTLREIQEKLLENNINIGKSSINLALRKLDINLRPPTFRMIFSQIAALKQEQQMQDTHYMPPCPDFTTGIMDSNADEGT